MFPCVAAAICLLQIAAFVPEYWGGEVYHDVDKAFYKVSNSMLDSSSRLPCVSPSAAHAMHAQASFQ